MTDISRMSIARNCIARQFRDSFSFITITLQLSQSRSIPVCNNDTRQLMRVYRFRVVCNCLIIVISLPSHSIISKILYHAPAFILVLVVSQ